MISLKKLKEQLLIMFKQRRYTHIDESPGKIKLPGGDTLYNYKNNGGVWVLVISEITASGKIKKQSYSDVKKYVADKKISNLIVVVPTFDDFINSPNNLRTKPYFIQEFSVFDLLINPVEYAWTQEISEVVLPRGDITMTNPKSSPEDVFPKLSANDPVVKYLGIKPGSIVEVRPVKPMPGHLISEYLEYKFVTIIDQTKIYDEDDGNDNKRKIKDKSFDRKIQDDDDDDDDDDAPSPPSINEFPCPLANTMGNTCYINSLIWMMVALHWDNDFYNLSLRDDDDGDDFYNLMKIMKYGDIEDIKPIHYSFVKKYNMSARRHQDIGEFFIHLTKRMLGDTPLDDSHSVVVLPDFSWLEKFKIQSQIISICDDPVDESKLLTQELFIELKIGGDGDISSMITLNKLFDDYNSPEVIKEARTSDNSKCKGIFTRKHDIVEFNDIIMIKVNRLKSVGKLRDIQPFRQIVDRIPIIMPLIYNFGVHTIHPETPLHYNLISFAVQSGIKDGTSGHYVAFVKIRDIWYKYNDSTEKEIIPADEIEKEAQNGYMFIYMRV